MKYVMKSEVLTVTSKKMPVFWDVAVYTPIDTDGYFRGATASITRVRQ
jgi:hypothetical protein